MLHITWDNDEACQKLVKYHFPQSVQRGDILKEDANQVIHLVNRHDPHQTSMVLFLSAPPCPDFSQIKENNVGLSGTEGSKFTAYVKLVHDIEAGLGHRQVRHLAENVVMQQKSEVEYISQTLRSNAVVLDAGDFGMVSRPRLWWSRTNWSEHTKDPISGCDLRWGKFQGFPRLYFEGPKDDINNYQLWGYSFSQQVQDGQVRMPCLTTPAPDERGRPAPKRAKGKLSEEARNHWLRYGRQYAPWHYEAPALMSNSNGQLSTPPIWVKEQMHHLPVDYTNMEDISDRERHKMPGNSWHLGVVKYLLLFILQWHVGSSIAAPPKTSAIRFMLDHINFNRPMLGPGVWEHNRFVMEPTTSMEEHWRVAQICVHPQLTDPELEPGVLNTVETISFLFGDIPRLRQEVICEIRYLLEEFEEVTWQWWHQIPHHVKEVYDHKEDNNITQVPLMLHLLKECSFPGITDLTHDLNFGFDIVGPQNPGVGWVPRLDGRYSNPLDMETFIRFNHQHILERLDPPRVDTHWKVMLDELLADRESGKLTGPYRAPSGWPVPTVTVNGLPLLDTPAGHVCVAACFSVQQTDKIRRCEDYRRSGHNCTICTIRASDTPHHHTISHYAQLARYWISKTGQCTTWAHDLDAAYRQAAVRDTQYSFVLLNTPMGPTLWRHNALCFGATASVWAFNRLADSLTFLGRCLLAIPILHFVDDFGSCEPERLAKTSFLHFADMTSLLGLKMKAKKANPPAARLKMLGVFISCEVNQVLLQPCPARLQKVLATMGEALENNHLTADSAQKLAGKLTFLQTTTFGQVGKAALYTIYSRGAQIDGGQHTLTHALRAALITLRSMLKNFEPRCLPVVGAQESGVMYTDAFFSPGDDTKKYKPHEASLHWHPSQVRSVDHGWGYVFTVGDQTFFSHGKAPSALLHRYGKRKAFIYFLELLAPIVLVASLHQVLPKFLVAFIDNQAGLMAITKGYGSDKAVNGMLTFFWALVARLKIFIHFEWVPSDLNISDPISRREFSIADRLGWTRVDPSLEHIYKILLRCAGDLEYAASLAVDECLEAGWTSGCNPSCRVGLKVPEVVGSGHCLEGRRLKLLSMALDPNAPTALEEKGQVRLEGACTGIASQEAVVLSEWDWCCDCTFCAKKHNIEWISNHYFFWSDLMILDWRQVLGSIWKNPTLSHPLSNSNFASIPRAYSHSEL